MFDKPPEKEVKLSSAELQFIYGVLYKKKWSGPAWEQTITPLLKKLGLIIQAPKPKK